MPDDAMTVAHEAKGMASEAIMAVRSEAKLTLLRFGSMEKSQEDIKKLIHEADRKIETNTTAIYDKIDECMIATNKKIDDLASKYDAKFWSLAIIIIAALLAGMVGLIVKPGIH